MKVLVVVGLLLSACTERNPDFCASDADCAGTPQPFCDVNGEFPESNGTAHICTPTPADCPVERCGCTPGESLACDVDQLTVCAADGTSTTTETCGLGCSTEDRCLTFEPSNGLGPALEMAAAEPDVVLPPNARIDTELGLVQDVNGDPIEIKSLVISQDGGTSIRAFLARSFVIDSATVRGARAFAIVAHAGIAVTGNIDASAQGRENGPAAQDSPAVCVGASRQIEPPNCQFACGTEGGGGGGNATTGAAGGGYNTPGGAGGTLIPSFVPLVGGCRGGSLRDNMGAPFSGGGAGGGAVQLIAGDRIVFSASGFVDVGGGGGLSSTGGGSGGTVIMESPQITFDGAATGVAANGGAGGGCESNGADATPTNVPALAPTCTNRSAGNGATRISPPQPGELRCPGATCDTLTFQGGGGGAVGRLRTATRNGELELKGGPLLSAVLTSESLTTR